MDFDYLIVGAGLTGATFAHQLLKKNKRVLIIDKNKYVGGNCYTKKIEGIDIHLHGPHVFHTDNKKIWDYINQFSEFNNFINKPKVVYQNKLYSFPINLMTFNQIWGIKTPYEAKQKINEIRINFAPPKNIEEFCLSQIGQELYEIFIKGYTTKQWAKSPKNLPIDIIKRIPIRFDYNEAYYNDKYQGIPVNGYTEIIEKMIYGSIVKLETNYFNNREYWNNQAKYIIYTGKIDEFFDYSLGHLEYRSLEFDTKIMDMESFQGNAVINYTDEFIPYTRSIEYKYFNYKDNPSTVVVKEFPQKHNKNNEPYYPINNKKNNELYYKYRNLIKENNMLFAGRLGKYSYIDMDDAIIEAINLSENL